MVWSAVGSRNAFTALNAIANGTGEKKSETHQKPSLAFIDARNGILDTGYWILDTGKKRKGIEPELTVQHQGNMLGDVKGAPILNDAVLNLGVVVTEEAGFVGCHDLIIPCTARRAWMVNQMKR